MSLIDDFKEFIEGMIPDIDDPNTQYKQALNNLLEDTIDE